MIITFLGTGTSQGVPVIACDCEVCRSLDYRDKRLRSSVHIKTQVTSIIIDSGPDFRQQVLRERINRLDVLLFTHEHKDHTAGMDDVRGFNYKQKSKIPVYAESRVIEQLKKEFSYVFESKYPGLPQIEINYINDQLDPFFINKDKIIPIRVMHHKLPVLAFRVGDFSYITDAKYVPAEEKEKIRGSKVLVINALRKESHLSHYNLDEALELAAEMNAEKTYFTHLSHGMGLHKDVSAHLPDGVELAYDGLQVQI
ncbi:MAG: MBL fold metallo-hydrolase [Candidatus Cyclobacteriaceae bacterium M3_2C_046]